jgi:hypothetical protein
MLKVDDVTVSIEPTTTSMRKEKKTTTPMTLISGLRKLKHANSFSAGIVPKYGVETPHEQELGVVSIPCELNFLYSWNSWDSQLLAGKSWEFRFLQIMVLE